MTDVNYWAVLVSAAVVFVLASVYYAVLAKVWQQASPAAADVAPAAWKPPVEFVRSLVLAFVIAYLAHEMGIDTWARGAVFGLVLWVGFPAMLWSGAMLWENTSWRLAALHAGDWLIKLLVIGVIVGVWT